MNELILNFHGVGQAHSEVGAEEAVVWWEERPFLMALDEVSTAARLSFPIRVTFDDGNASDYEIALPALLERGLTATFFVCAGRIGKQHYLDSEAISDLVRNGMSIGSHGMHHVDWRRLGSEELDWEIVAAREKLEGVIGQRVPEVSIPFGSYDRRVIGRLKQSNWKCVLSSDGGFARRDAWLKPRHTLRRDWQGGAIVDRITASETPLVVLQRRLRGIMKRCR